jgi:two-component system chemotaxis sensor kinase CheA
LSDIIAGLERQLFALRERVVGARLVPIGDVLERMQFAALDLARDQQKQLLVELAGQETELDRFLVEQMLDPLLHLVRNAVVHGLESPEERLAAGKPAAGRLLLRAAGAGDQIVLHVEDDGPGIDLTAVAARARTLGLLPEGAVLDAGNEPLLLDVLTSAGLTTREEADLTSGRGVGLLIVRGRVQSLGGSLSVATRAGEGTRFTIRLPLTLAITDALLVTANEQVYAVPQSVVREVVEVPPGAVVPLDPAGNEALSYRGGVLPVVRLARLIQVPRSTGRTGSAPDGHGRGYALVAGSGTDRAGLVVDRILGRREIVTQALEHPWLHVHGVSGAAQLGDGHIALILDAPALLRLAPADAGESEESMAAPPAPSEPYILFSLAGATYGLPSRVVRQVEMLEQIAPLPEVPPFVDGVVPSRGQMIPAISLRARFGFQRVPYDLRTRLIVIEEGGRTVGLIVDAAREFMSIPDQAIHAPPEAIAGVSGDWLSGIASIGERLVLILSAERVLSLAQTPIPGQGKEADEPPAGGDGDRL